MSRGRALILAGAVALLSSGCGLVRVDGGPDGGAADAGPACFDDADCVPDKCCGRGEAAVHAGEGPDCSLVFCDGKCPEAQLRCGCAIPVCRNQRCQVAVTSAPGCP